MSLAVVRTIKKKQRTSPFGARAVTRALLTAGYGGVPRPLPMTARMRATPAGWGGLLHERKFSDLATATYQVNTTGSFTLLHIPVSGADFNQRVGRKTLARSIFIRGRVLLEMAAGVTTGSENAQEARMIVFVDAQPNKAAPAVTDLLVEALPSSQLNANNRDRFRVIADKNYVFDPLALNTTATQTWSMSGRTIWHIKLYRKTLTESIFDATNGGTIADITSGAIYMFWIGNVAAGTNVDTNAIVSTRVRYDDV